MNSENVLIEIINGLEGRDIYMDGRRVAGAKLLHGGIVEYTWLANRKDILRALNIETEDNFDKE